MNSPPLSDQIRITAEKLTRPHPSKSALRQRNSPPSIGSKSASGQRNSPLPIQANPHPGSWTHGPLSQQICNNTSEQVKCDCLCLYQVLCNIGLGTRVSRTKIIHSKKIYSKITVLALESWNKINLSRLKNSWKFLIRVNLYRITAKYILLVSMTQRRQIFKFYHY